MTKFISGLPSRCVQILGIDATGRTGLDSSGAEIHSPAIGAVHREQENENGRMLRLFLEDNKMLAANTVIDNMEATYWSTSRSSSTRIDYVCVPQGLHALGRICGERVLRRLGDRLQLIRTSFRADHRPVSCSFSIQFSYVTQAKQQVRHDRDLPMRDLLSGQRNAELIRETEQALDSAEFWHDLEPGHRQEIAVAHVQ
eukprot:TRINITY_DN63293_c0_g1_i1.p1 TRINITY_DN63293_c0_g1~~TRINITY_DN63293_c0_g1_i1.p1  ORF type:complete len:216 (+),score=11.61 TRINITY_DN63293_c0_g1_i1:52-648(+)